MIDDLCSDRTIIYTICGNTQIGWGKERKQVKGIGRVLVNFFIEEKSEELELSKTGCRGILLGNRFPITWID